MISWTRPTGAAKFEVHIDDDPGFGSPELSLTTVNTSAVPTKLLRAGEQNVRVRAFDKAGTAGPWSETSFFIADFAPPSPVSPASGETLEQPDNPPLLSWTPVAGATSYVVEVDREDDFVGVDSFKTETTTLLYPKALTATQTPYFWRVKAIKASGIESAFSEAASFKVTPLPTPTPVDTGADVQDVVMDWEPVPGAKWYQVRVALDQDFNTIIDTQTKVLGTRYSPAVTYDNNQYFWQVRPVDLNGQAPEWPLEAQTFRRSWPDAPTLVHPSNGASTSSGLFYEWTPVPHATQYQIQFSTDANFSTSKLCQTAGTTYTPFAYATDEARGTGVIRIPHEECYPKEPGTTYYWRVRALDLPFKTPGVEGIYSETRSFTWADPGVVVPDAAPTSPVTGQSIALTGTGFAAGQQCTDRSPSICGDVPSTPVFRWDAVPGANEYRIYLAEDSEFTQLLEPVAKIASTSNTIWAPTMASEKSAFPDSEAGGSYYWMVRACARTSRTVVKCGPSPISIPGMATGQFRKVSPSVQVDSTVVTGASEVTFNWADYLATNQTTAWRGAKSNQAAKQYRIQVADNPSFTSPLTNATVDQTTYTAPDKLYPEGNLYWRVQAIDADNNALTWSPVQTFQKSTAAVQLTSPGDGESISGLDAFRWEAQAFAGSYDIEIYKENDTAFSSVNRVVSAKATQSAFTWDRQLPASNVPYVWRVRRADASGNKGPWSRTGSFRVTGSAPELLSPSDKVDVKADGARFSWAPVGAASSYELEIRSTSGTRNWATISTPALGWANDKVIPDGSWQWRVTARNARRNPIGTSGWRTFYTDGNAPKVASVTPRSVAKAKNSFKATFNEPVNGVSKKSMKLYVKGSKKALKAKVKYKGVTATLKPAKKLKKGKTYTVKLSSAIKDRKGNRLTPYSWSVRVY
ncbi:Ig-like domain-containing protein [Nocardioides daejeonensis]|uniref:Ig-like domain-containing protein n=1 Tax=Nocardioides daejeonensis TaxID=1046556 RepID=UPI0013A59A5B|nr:Ig-like domain-containing protein [Nocardioides daejeonensis]